MPTYHLHPTPAHGAIRGRPSGKIPDNYRGDPTCTFPPCFYLCAETIDVRDAIGSILPSSGRPSTILCRGGHPGQTRIALFKGGPEEYYQKWSPCVSVHPGDVMFHLGVDAEEGVGWN